MLLRRRQNEHARGQSLAEFALVFPFFMIILFGVIEFAFVFNAMLSIEFATRDAALSAAEAGRATDADCSVLRVVNNSIGAPADPKQITKVSIFLADANGKNTKGKENVYSLTGSGTAACPGLPFKAVSASYPSTSRCDVLNRAGCAADAGNNTVDTIGVQITYVYTWKTPLASLLPMSGPGYTMTSDNAMRMEPTL